MTDIITKAGRKDGLVEWGPEDRTVYNSEVSWIIHYALPAYSKKHVFAGFPPNINRLSKAIELWKIKNKMEDHD